MSRDRPGSNDLTAEVRDVLCVPLSNQGSGLSPLRCIIQLHTFAVRKESMDNVSLIRVVAGVLAVLVVVILIFRARKKAPR